MSLVKQFDLEEKEQNGFGGICVQRCPGKR